MAARLRGVGEGVFDRAEAFLFCAEAGDAGDESFCVGVPGIFQDRVGVAGFDDLAAIHDGDALAEAADDGEVVGDQQKRHAEFGAEAFEFGENLGLDGDVERGGGFVGDKQARAAGEGHGDHGALLHAAAELVGVVAHAFRGIDDADGGEPFLDLGVEIFHLGAVEPDAFGDLAADGEDRVERGGGFLENVGDAAAAHGAEFGGGER